MPSVAENQLRWTEYPWERDGHEWSPGQTAAGGEMLWWRGLRPRIARHVPAASILEIGPGFGRWTQYLLRLCDQLTAIDLTERCIEHCRVKFAAHPQFTAWTNDGESLDVVPDGSLDFVFSFDSLVHAEAPVLRRYLQQLARKLKPGGTGFIHHSNLRALADASGRFPPWLTRTNWRAPTMSARLFREYCAEAGLRCSSQEVINWISRSRRADRHRVPGDGLPLTDALSVFERPGAPGPPEWTRVYLNPQFVDEWRQIVVLTSVYGGGGERDSIAAPIAESAAGRRPSLRGRARDKAAHLTDHARSYARDRLSAWRAARHEPILNAVRERRCPDCAQPLSGDRRCSGCRVQFIV